MRLILAVFMVATATADAKWAASWTASVHGPYPAGNASAQPNLKFAFPTGEARDQTFRLIVRPDIWGKQARLRFSNVFGTKPVTLDGVYAGIHAGGGAVTRGTNHVVRFGGKASVTIPAGGMVWSDAVAVSGKSGKLAVSFHVVGESGPMTWHAKALSTSYLTAPGAGAKGADEVETAFPFTTTSWYFLDAVEMASKAQVIVCFGDSITDGTASTLNGDDRWPDALSRRLHAVYGTRVAVVNAGIGGNRVANPAINGGPAAGQRLERDVLSLSGVSTVIWLEGINDLSAGTAVAEIEAEMRRVTALIKAKGVHVIGATVVSALGSTSATVATPAVDTKRKELNEFIRGSGIFDAVADFDAVTLDATTGQMRPEFVPDSTTGGAGDRLHPNRAGYLAMAGSIDLKLLVK